MKILNKDFDVYTILQAIDKDTAKKLFLQDDYSTLPDNIVTDGYGKFYFVPTDGKTPKIKVNNALFCDYNWGSKELNAYILLDYDENVSSDDIETEDSVYSLEVSATDFIDNPEYWCDYLADILDDTVANELAMLQYENDDDADKNYKYEIVLTVDFETSDYELAQKQYEGFVERLNKVVELYGQEIKISAVFNSSFNTVSVIVNSPVELTKDEILEIYDIEDIEEYLKNEKDNDKHYIIKNIEMYNIFTA